MISYAAFCEYARSNPEQVIHPEEIEEDLRTLGVLSLRDHTPDRHVIELFGECALTSFRAIAKA